MQSHRGGNREVGWARATMSPGHSQAGDSSVWTSGLVTGPFLRQQTLVLGRFAQMATFQSFPCSPHVLLVVQHPTITAIKPEHFQLDSQGSL